MATRWKTEIVEKEVEIDFDELRKKVLLKNIILLRSNLMPGLYFSGRPDNEKTYINFSFEPSVYKDKAICFLEVSVDYSKILEEDGQEGYTEYKLKLEVIGEFSVSDGLNLGDVELFLQSEGPTVMWPYIQNYASEQIERTSYGAELLPTINGEELVENITDQLEYYDHEKENLGDGYLRAEIQRDGTRRVWAF